MEDPISQIYQTEIASLHKRIAKLESAVASLKKENTLLRTKFSSTELLLQKIITQLNIDNMKKSPQSFQEEPWLFNIQQSKKYKKEKIISLLDLKSSEITFVDIPSNNFNSEKELFILILNTFDSLSEFKKDLQSMDLNSLIECFEEVFEVAVIGDFVIVIRDVDVNNKNIIQAIGTLSGIMISSFNKSLKNMELIGRMNLVLESKKEMNVVNIIKKDNSRVILQIDKL